MRAVVQRVTSASVTVAGEAVGSIAEPGLLVLVGATHDDTAATAEALADKVWNLRIMAGERSCADLAAPLLVVSQFTLYADTRKTPPVVERRRPGSSERTVDRRVRRGPAHPRRPGRDRTLRRHDGCRLGERRADDHLPRSVTRRTRRRPFSGW